MENNTVKVKINGVEVEVPKGSTILEAAHIAGIRIPTLCYLKDINAIGACRICVAEVKGARSLVASCVFPITEGMEIFTNSERVRKSRRLTLELILSNHNMTCLSCSRNTNCELQKLAKEFGIESVRFGEGDMNSDFEQSTPSIVRDNSKCILCRRCVSACSKLQHVSVIGTNDRGFDTHVGPAFDKVLAEVPCVSCGQCTVVCPTGALTEKDDTAKVWEALNDPSKYVIFGTAPSVRAQLGECFGMPIGTNVEGKMVAAIRRLGVHAVFDVDTAADFTIMEEGTEFIERVKEGGVLPLITSCSPGWIKFAEYYYPEFIPNLSSSKSPQQMFGALMKTYYAKEKGIDPKDMFIVGVMPCTAKKFEIEREYQSAVEGLRDIDSSITTRELASMIDRAGLRFTELPDEKFDPAFGIASGAAHIFGATGGVMEAALRTVVEILTGESAPGVDFKDVRGTAGIKEAEYEVAGLKVRVAVVSGLTNARKLLDKVKSGEAQYHFIEVMACPGGCVNGGGQPLQPADVRNFTDIRAKRAKALYDEDAAMTLRKSHENPIVQKVYAEFLEKPGSHKAHKLLHTKYMKRDSYLNK